MRAFIPPEILSQIFIYAKPTNIIDRELSPHYSPVLPTCVCRYWRSVAQSTPQLWTELYLPDIPFQPWNIDVLFKAVQRWLSYSRQLPISLHLTSTELDKAILKRYVTILSAHARRWKNVSFEFMLPDPDVFSMFQGHSMPVLESLSFMATDPDVPGSFTPPAWKFWGSLYLAPRLRSVTLSHPLSTILLTPSPIITSIDVKLLSTRVRTTINLSRFLLCISCCPKLAYLKICYEGDEEDINFLATIGGPRVTLRNLKTLDLRFEQSPSIFKTFLDRLILPNLQRFEVAASDGNRELYHSLSDFISRVSPTLLSFRSSGKLLNNSYLAETCQRLPFLTDLSVWDYMVAGNSFIKSLRFTFHPDGRLYYGQNTKVENLDIYVTGGWSGYGCTFAEYYIRILEVVQSRWKLPQGARDHAGKEIKPLKSMRFSGWSEQRIKRDAPSVYEALMQLKQEGLVVTFQQCPSVEALEEYFFREIPIAFRMF